MAVKLKFKLPTATVKKKSPAQILDEQRKLNKASAGQSKTQSATIKTTTGTTAKTSSAVSGGTVKTSGTTTTAPKYSTTAKGTESIPNTAAGLIKKPGILATFTAGGLLGALGTSLAGAANSILPGGNEDLSENYPSPLSEPENGGEPTILDDLNTQAADLLDPLSDVPLLGDAVAEAEEGGWSALLLVGLAVAGIAAGVFIYKRLNKKPARKTTKRKARK